MSNNFPYRELGSRIREVRQKAKLTQAQFAEKVKISRGYLSEIEKGKTKPSNLVLLAVRNVFAVKRQWLETGEGILYDDRWSLLKDRARELGEDIYIKLLSGERSKEHMAEIAEQLPPAAEEGEIFSIGLKAHIARHNKKMIGKLMGQLARVINEGDHRKTSALQAFLDVLDPGEAGNDEGKG